MLSALWGDWTRYFLGLLPALKLNNSVICQMRKTELNGAEAQEVERSWLRPYDSWVTKVSQQQFPCCCSHCSSNGCQSHHHPGMHRSCLTSVSAIWAPTAQWAPFSWALRRTGSFYTDCKVLGSFATRSSTLSQTLSLMKRAHLQSIPNAQVGVRGGLEMAPYLFFLQKVLSNLVLLCFCVVLNVNNLYYFKSVCMPGGSLHQRP